jgi:hypothetical protein
MKILDYLKGTLIVVLVILIISLFFIILLSDSDPNKRREKEAKPYIEQINELNGDDIASIKFYISAYIDNKYENRGELVLRVTNDESLNKFSDLMKSTTYWVPNHPLGIKSYFVDIELKSGEVLSYSFTTLYKDSSMVYIYCIRHGKTGWVHYYARLKNSELYDWMENLELLDGVP